MGNLFSTRLHHQIVISFDTLVMNVGAIVCLGSFPSNTLSAVAVPQHPAATAEYFYKHPIHPRPCVTGLSTACSQDRISQRPPPLDNRMNGRNHPGNRRINKTRRLTIVQYSTAHDRVRRIYSKCNNGANWPISAEPRGWIPCPKDRTEGHGGSANCGEPWKPARLPLSISRLSSCRRVKFVITKH